MQQSQKQSQLIQKTNIETELLSIKQNPYTHDQTIMDQVQPASYSELFYFADRLDFVIMAIATLFSLGNGVSIVFYSIPIKELINVFSDNVPKDQIVQATLRSVYGFLINSAILFLNCWLMTAGWVITSQRQMNKARKQYFAALLKQEIAWHDRTKPAEICSKMYVQISKVQQGLVTNMTSVLNKVSMGLSGIVMALAVGYQMALVMIGFLPVMMASGFIRGYFTKQKDMYMQTKKIKLDSDVIQVFDNIKTVKMLGSQDYESERYQKLVKKEEETLWSHGWKGSLAFTFFFFCIIANYALGFWYGTKMVADQVINKNTGSVYNVGEVIVIFFTLYISNLSLSGLPDSVASFSVSRYSMRKILAVVSRTPRIKDGHITMPDNIGSIMFNNVSFSYDRPLFQNLSLKLEKGTTALIGQSGCGKSTIISLLMRFYDVTKGSIQFVCGEKTINLNQLTNNSLRQKIGYVGQQPILIGKTIREVLMAQQYNDQAIYQVLELVKADKFVREIGLYSQYKSVSGGQKQRLAIARALLKKPKILILDESTSALDQKTQQQVLNNLIKCGIDYIIMVAHRYSTLKYANTIIKLNKSHIQFSGTYEQLISTNIINIVQQTQDKKHNKVKEQQNLSNNMQQSIDVIRQKIEKSLEQQQEKKDEGEGNKFNDLVFEMGYFMKLIKLNKDKWYLYVLGVIGAVYFGCIFPVFSYLISRIIFILQNIAMADPNTLPGYQGQAHALATLLFVISFGSLIFTTMRWIIFEYFNEKIGFIVKSSAFKKLVHKNYPEIQQQGPHTYSYMINKSCDDLKPLAGNFLPMIIENLITLVVGLGIAFVYSWQITGVSLLIMPLILLSSKMMMSFNHGMQSNTEEIHKKNHELVITSVMYLRTVRSCHLEDRICAKYGKQLDDALKASIKYGNLSGILFGIGQTLISCTFAVIFLIGSVMIKNDIINVQDLYTAIFAVMFAGVQAGGNLYFLGQLQAAKTGASVYFQLIDKNTIDEAFIEDLSDPAMKQMGTGPIIFQNISFGYETRNANIFNNLNLTIKNNQKVAIVGESGSGKSSITNLLFRLYNPKDGQITIDGQQLNKISKNKLSKILGIVMQEPALFNRSVYENLRYNNVDVTDQELVEVVKAANAYDFIVDGNFGLEEQTDKEISKNMSRLHHGFSKVVGPRGSYLSGGQKQRLSIARALIRKPKILVLDEATSALDGQNEKIIQQTVSGMKNMTQIIIAHRLETIRDCDRIVVLKNGSIVQQGSYSQLIKKGGYFAELSASKSFAE